jgi:hypothetical protein
VDRITLPLAGGLALELRGLPSPLVGRIVEFLSPALPGVGIDVAGPPLAIEAAAELQAAGSILLAERDGLRASAAGERLLLEAPGAAAWCDPAAGRGGLRLFDPGEETLDRVVRLLLPPLLFELAGARAVLGLHAAAVAVGRRGILLPGAGGQGKSTIFRAAASAGLGLLSDDLVWLADDAHGGLRALPFPRGAPYPPQPGPTVGEAGLAAVVFPERRADGPSRTTPIGRDESLSRLAAQAGMLARGHAVAARFRLLVRAAQLPAFRLEMADGDLDGAPAHLSALAHGPDPGREGGGSAPTVRAGDAPATGPGPARAPALPARRRRPR